MIQSLHHSHKRSSSRLHSNCLHLILRFKATSWSFQRKIQLHVNIHTSYLKCCRSNPGFKSFSPEWGFWMWSWILKRSLGKKMMFILFHQMKHGVCSRYSFRPWVSGKRVSKSLSLGVSLTLWCFTTLAPRIEVTLERRVLASHGPQWVQKWTLKKSTCVSCGMNEEVTSLPSSTLSG